MSNYIKLLNNLEELGLNNIKNNIDMYLNLIKSGEKSVRCSICIMIPEN
ncbi:hypothetical protein [Thermoanaerobacter wiegelii]|nr:hypothetical protein [Thermoanaerobacter wiegelii]